MNETSNVTTLTSRPQDTCDPLTSTHTLKATESALHCVTLPIIALLLGIPGNVLCLCVFWKQGVRERVNVLLFSLAMADLAKLVLLLSLQVNCVIILFGSVQDAENWESATQYIVVQYSRYFNLVSVQLIALMALDRAFSVSLPLVAHRILSFGRMLSAIVTIYVVSLVLFMPMLLLYTIRWTEDPSTNATIAVLSYRPGYPFHPDVPRQIIGIASGVVKPTSVFIVTISSILVVVKLRAARRTRNQMANSQTESKTGQSEAKITNMLLSVCVLFIIFMLPETTGLLVNYFLPEFGLRGCYRNTLHLFFRVVSVASCVNSSANFVAYASLSAKFRTTLRQILRCSSLLSTAEDTSNPGASATSASRLTDA